MPRRPRRPGRARSSAAAERIGFGDQIAGCVRAAIADRPGAGSRSRPRSGPRRWSCAGGRRRAPRGSGPRTRSPRTAGWSSRPPADQCVAVKPQVACFERLGAPGWAALREVMHAAAQRGLVVIADAKRGDIDISARAYAQAFFGPTPTPFGDVAGLGADALTVNPLLGRDSLRRSSRPPARAAPACSPSPAPPTRAPPTSRTASWPPAARSARRSPGCSTSWARRGGRSGLADVGAVAGATAPERLEALRALMPHAVRLLPGIGAQGGNGGDLAPAFAPGPAGGLVSASRAIVYAHERRGRRRSARHARATRRRGCASSSGACTPGPRVPPKRRGKASGPPV